MKDRRVRAFTYCAQCLVKVYRPPSKLAQQPETFCTRVCKNVHMWQTKPPSFATGETTYRARALAIYGAACQWPGCGWSEIPDVLEAHHKDGDRSNNSDANLAVLCPTHHRVTHYLEKSGPWMTGLRTGHTGPFGVVSDKVDALAYTPIPTLVPHDLHQSERPARQLRRYRPSTYELQRNTLEG